MNIAKVLQTLYEILAHLFVSHINYKAYPLGRAIYVAQVPTVCSWFKNDLNYELLAYKNAYIFNDQILLQKWEISVCNYRTIMKQNTINSVKSKERERNGENLRKEELIKIDFHWVKMNKITTVFYIQKLYSKLMK